jgi:hypothetical protein
MFDVKFTFTGLTNVKPRRGLIASDFALASNCGCFNCLFTDTEIILVFYLWQEHAALLESHL